MFHIETFLDCRKTILPSNWGVVRGGYSPSDLKMRFSRACTAKTAPITGWRGERRASESPYSQAKALEERFRLEACRLFRHAQMFHNETFYIHTYAIVTGTRQNAQFCTLARNLKNLRHKFLYFSHKMVYNKRRNSEETEKRSASEAKFGRMEKKSFS